MQKLPNLFLIGTQKGGSTSLYDALVRHPEIGRLPYKEPNIFSLASEDEARRRLAECPAKEGEHRYVLDGSVDYTRHPLYSKTPRNILKICGPDVRFVYILRNPVDRLVSQYFWKQNLYGQPLSFEEAIETEPQYVKTSLYDLQIERYFEVFDRDRFHFVRHGDFTRDPVGRTAEIYRWLGLDPDLAAGELRRSGATDKETTLAARFGPLNRLLWSSPRLRAMVRKVLPEAMARQAARMVSVEVAREEPSRKLKRRLLEKHFLESIVRTERLTGLDLSDWTTAYAAAASAGETTPAA